MMLRPYQKEAVDYAIREKRSVLVLPTGTGKTIIGAYFLKNLFKKGIRKAIVLVPTRILVEQTYRVYRNLGLSCEKIYGIYPKSIREKTWEKSNIVISTPETVYNDLDIIGKIDAVVVDECHHSVGDDAYAKVLKTIDCEYRLGLSAFIPLRRRKEIEELIGKIRIWSISDVKQFVPDWIGDVFETKFNKREAEIYNEIEKRRNLAKKTEKLLYTSALKFFAKDGALALKESLSKKSKLSKLLEDLRDEVEKLRDLHKLEKLLKVLEIYEGFNKAIVFVERVVVAKRLLEVLSKRYRASIVIGGQKSKEEMLESALESDVIISTSAGEEGVDLPVADLLINWSNTSSPLRFIQRHGRIMRKVGRDLKFVVYLVTPDTIDVDDLIVSIDQAKKVMDINIEREVLEELWKTSRRHKIIEKLTEPMPAEWIQQITGRTNSEIVFALRKACEEGEVVYIYTHLGKTYIRRDFIDKLKYFEKYLNPKHMGKVKLKVNKRSRIITGDFEKLKNELLKYLPLKKLEITVIKKAGDIEEYDFKSYNFFIDSQKILEIVLKNALSI